MLTDQTPSRSTQLAADALARNLPCDMVGPMTDFEKAQHHVNEGRRIVAEQRARVAGLRAHGRDAYMAQQDLQLFEDSLAIFEDYLAHLQRQQVR